MIALIQRVSFAQVRVEEHIVGEIGQGLLVFLGVQANDDETRALRLLEKVLSYRVFGDEDDKMNLNVCQVGGELLVVSQFTLAADTKKGLRPNFSSAAKPELAKQLYDYFHQEAAKRIRTQTGQFAAKMQVALQNDGPVTFWLEV